MFILLFRVIFYILSSIYGFYYRTIFIRTIFISLSF